MELPCPKIVRTIDSDAATFFLLFSLILAEPEVLPGNMIPRDTSGMGVDVVAVCVPPSTTWSDPFGGCEGGKESADND